MSSPGETYQRGVDNSLSLV